MATLAFWELAGYPKESANTDSFSATRKMLIEWDMRYYLQASLLGHPGALYPYIPDYAARCVAVSIEPFGGIDRHMIYADRAEYGYALLTAKYKTPQMGDPQPYPQAKSPALHASPQAVISESLEPTSEAMRLDFTKFKWSDGAALTADEAPIRQVYRMAYSMTRHNLTEVPAFTQDYVGGCNAATITPVLMDTMVFGPFTLLYISPVIGLSIDDQGNRQFNVSYRFAYKAEGWRKVWRADTEDYQTIVHKDTDVDYESPPAFQFGNLFPRLGLPIEED